MKHKNIYKQSQSILSRGPRNPNDKRCNRSERKIHRAIRHGLRNRLINFHALDICRLANISEPTFYLHCRNSNQALRSYEDKLISEFTNSFHVPHPNREIVFTTLLGFVHKHRHYFSATLPNHETWLLHQIFSKIRRNLISSNIKDKCYDLYIDNLIALISCWSKYDKYNLKTLPLYTKKLMQVRVMDLGI